MEITFKENVFDKRNKLSEFEEILLRIYYTGFVEGKGFEVLVGNSMIDVDEAKAALKKLVMECVPKERFIDAGHTICRTQMLKAIEERFK